MKAVFRLPHSEEFLWITHQEHNNVLVEYHSFDENTTIELASNSFETLHSNQLQEKLSDYNIGDVLDEALKFPAEEEYLEKLSKAIETITENRLKKLVISRPILKDSSHLNLFETYKNLCEKYPNTLCYLLLTDDENWIGATPEILGKFNKKTEEFFTMSLAGTLPVEEDWGDKEIEEQKPVTDYISNILSEFSRDIHQSDTYNHISGNIKHLRTDFSAKIKEKDIEKLISELHPTPAVCGIPKDFCKEKILEIENYNRNLYAGYIKIETPEEIYYFVNLRCAKIYKNHIVAYAGGGITAKSSPEKEWKETELKSQAILNNLIF